MAESKSKYAAFSVSRFPSSFLVGLFCWRAAETCPQRIHVRPAFHVQRVLDFIDEPENRNTSSISYGLIGAYGTVYIGMAVSYAVFSHKTYRLLTLYRGALVALIYDRSLRVSSTAPADAEAVTLMSADIDRIGSSFPLIHETWASFVEIALALWLLYRLLGVAMVAPILWIIITIVAGIPITTAAGNAQTPWLEAIEKRLAVTAKTGAIKAVKMAGLAETVSQKITALRLAEIRASWRHRVLGVCVTMVLYASSTLAPAWGVGVYILAKSRNTGTLSESVAFAALSLFELLDQPLIFAVDGVEHLQTVLNSFRRIQEYLVSEERAEYRIISGTTGSSCSTLKNPEGFRSDIELSEMEKEKSERLFGPGYVEEHAPIARLDQSSAGYAADGEFILRKLTFDIPRARTTMIFGPVGCGKSTLLKHLLGEMRCTSGTLEVNFARAAYCPQTPWITWGMVRENILGQSTFDQLWYDTVIDACSLRADIRELPSGDETMTGTRGSRLSGGQQMRLSLARALYARIPMVILDDVLKGLDRMTERSILDSVFGAQGILKTRSDCNNGNELL